MENDPRVIEFVRLMGELKEGDVQLMKIDDIKNEEERRLQRHTLVTAKFRIQDELNQLEKMIRTLIINDVFTLEEVCSFFEAQDWFYLVLIKNGEKPIIAFYVLKIITMGTKTATYNDFKNGHFGEPSVLFDDDENIKRFDFSNTRYSADTLRSFAKSIAIRGHVPNNVMNGDLYKLYDLANYLNCKTLMTNCTPVLIKQLLIMWQPTYNHGDSIIDLFEQLQEEHDDDYPLVFEDERFNIKKHFFDFLYNGATVDDLTGDDAYKFCEYCKWVGYNDGLNKCASNTIRLLTMEWVTVARINKYSEDGYLEKKFKEFENTYSKKYPIIFEKEFYDQTKKLFNLWVQG
jgi:hypothetical protein